LKKGEGEKMDLKHLEIGKDHLEKVVENIKFNQYIEKHYLKLFAETKDETIQNKIERLRHCNDFWVIDKYEMAKIKDFKKTNLCRDKFCNNCKKVKQAARMAKFIPLLRPYADRMYQLTLTIPNVKGKDLKPSIDKIFKSFATLIEYFKGKKKLRGVDFEALGYEGAIRSLEVTFKGNEYHPHLHALLVLNINPLDKSMIRRHKNVYSIDFHNNREERLFSDVEILIQKVWYLLINGERVTKKAIDKLKKGYSCTLDKFKESDFIELFKYMTKATTEEEEPLKYGQFKTLYYALHSVRQIQGYGCFYNIKDDDEITMEEVEEMYNSIIEELQKEENPVETAERPTELLNDKEYTLISRKKVYSYLKQLKD
jgi:plasmid rolling circle replication initiator protein Rep